jgi:hypothetical protein
VPDSEFCVQCQAPLTLSHPPAHRQKSQPMLLAVLGPAGVGKTVYLATLVDMLFADKLPWQAVTRGAFSLHLRQETIPALAACRFPEKTPLDPDCWNWVHCELSFPRGRRMTELVVPDVSGEALLHEIDCPGSCETIRAFLAKTTKMMLLISAERLEANDREQMYFVLKLLSYLGETCKEQRGRKRRLQLAIVFSKADRCSALFDDPASSARQRTPELWRICNREFPRHRFFATSVVGACARCTGPSTETMHVPVRIEPRGVLEPFQWLLEERHQGHDLSKQDLTHSGLKRAPRSV